MASLPSTASGDTDRNMCGISVLLDTSGSPRFASRLLAMHSVIRHRGPDGEGFLVLDAQGTVVRADGIEPLSATTPPRLGFAFRRLKICDLTQAAAQPMGSPDGRTWVCFNGEIYNFRELRRELEGKGRVFRTSGDTEIVLAAFEEWGERAFARFEGMWAIVILDLRRNRLVVSRDRFGIKPLLWAIDDDGAMLFASEIKQILAARGSRAPRSNRALITMFLHGQRYPTTEETFFEGIRSVPPATWCAIDLAAPKKPSFQTYWSLADFTATHNAYAYEDAIARAEELLTRAVTSHRQADVKVGALLSGGLDSAVLVALAHRDGRSKLPTYSLGYRDAAPRYCEMHYVDAMVRRDGIENNETTFDAPWIAANTDRILRTLEEPPLAMPAFAQFRVFELCAQHGATVVLDGQGSDEIAAGYQYHQRALMKDQLLQGRPLAMLSELRAIARRDRRSAADVFADYFVRPYLRRRQPSPWIADGGLRDDASEFDFARRDYGYDPFLVNRLLYFDVRWGNVKIMLGYTDRNAMAHSVEARVPYFDRAFVELFFSLPDTYKIAKGDRKHLLRDIARRYVPPEITERGDRLGFGTPDEEMIRGPLRDTIAEAINDPAFRAAGWVNAPEASRFLLNFQQGHHADHRAVWRLFVLSRWARQFSVSI
jgi:asparagine synthase (glutamine-hydrolysing)